MRNHRIHTTGSCIAVLALAAMVGCSMENWDWFKRDAQTNRRSTGPRARRPVQPAVTEAPPPSEPALGAADDDTALSHKVEDHYARAKTPEYDDASYYGDDLTGRINRQSDPNRTHRIRQTASTAYDRPSGVPVNEGASDSTAADRRPAYDAGDGAAPRSEPRPSESTPPIKTATATPADTTAVAEQSPTPDDGLQPHELAPSNTTPSPSPDHGSTSTSDTPPGVKPHPKDAPAAAIQANAGAEGAVEPAGDSDDKATPAPPVLRGVTVTEAPSEGTASSGDSAKPASLAANVARPPAESAQRVDTFARRVTDLEAAVTKNPNDFDQQFRLRMLYLADGQDEKALSPTAGMDAELEELVQAYFRALIAARSDAGRDPATWATRQLESIEDLRERVRSRADLQVPKVLLCTNIDGYGIYDPIAPPEFTAGRRNEVVLYIEVDNYQSERITTGPKSGSQRTLLTVRQSLLRQDGHEIWNHTDENIEDVSRDRRRDFFLSAKVVIPKALSPGNYVLKVEVEDELAGKINSNTVKFKMLPG